MNTFISHPKTPSAPLNDVRCQHPIDFILQIWSLQVFKVDKDDCELPSPILVNASSKGALPHQPITVFFQEALCRSEKFQILVLGKLHSQKIGEIEAILVKGTRTGEKLFLAWAYKISIYCICQWLSGKIEKLQENGWFVRDGLEWHLWKGETNIVLDTVHTIIPKLSVTPSTTAEAFPALTFARTYNSVMLLLGFFF